MTLHPPSRGAGLSDSPDHGVESRSELLLIVLVIASAYALE